MSTGEDGFWWELRAWRHDLHRHPEFGFEEHRTSAFVADRLRGFGLDDVAEGIGGTGVVGTLRNIAAGVAAAHGRVAGRG